MSGTFLTKKTTLDIIIPPVVMSKRLADRKAYFASPGFMLRRLREWWEWTPQELAKRTGLHRSLILRMENNRADPRMSELRKLADALKVNVIMLLDHYTPLMWTDDFDKERLWKKVVKGNPKECWLWTGAKDPKSGYGKFGLRGKNEAPYRVVYAMTAPLPAHWQVDHTCGNRRCVNPIHLEAVTGGRNLYRRDKRLEREKIAKK